MEDHKGTKKFLYTMAKNFRNKNSESSEAVKDKNGNLLVEHGDISDRWEEYFEQVLNVRNKAFENTRTPVP